MENRSREIWLWNEIRYGNELALQQLYRHTYDSLFRYGLHLTGDRIKTMECINEMFTEVWVKRERLPEVQRVEGYLFISYKRKLSRHIRQHQKVVSLPEEDFARIDSNDQSYEELLIAMQTKEEMKSRVQKALNKLTPRQKELISLKYYEEMTMEEIADRLDISMRTIYNTLHAAISILRKELSANP